MTIYLIKIRQKFFENKNLKIVIIKNQNFICYNIKPISQIIKNKLSYYLKLNIIKLEKKILKKNYILIKKRI